MVYVYAPPEVPHPDNSGEFDVVSYTPLRINFKLSPVLSRIASEVTGKSERSGRGVGARAWSEAVYAVPTGKFKSVIHKQGHFLDVSKSIQNTPERIALDGDYEIIQTKRSILLGFTAVNSAVLERLVRLVGYVDEDAIASKSNDGNRVMIDIDSPIDDDRFGTVSALADRLDGVKRRASSGSELYVHSPVLRAYPEILHKIPRQQFESGIKKSA